MFTDVFSEFESIRNTQGSEAVLAKLAATFREQKQFHQLFDALLMQKKLALGAPLIRPTSFDDVPKESRDDFEESYVAAAREVGLLLLEEKQLGQAWMYLRTIRETEVMRQAIAKLNPKSDYSEEVIDIALYQGVSPVKGLEMMLQSHGTCSSITALDQLFMKLDPEARVACAGLLVKRIYSDLTETCQHEVERKQGLAAPGQTLRELIAGRDWLFADANYHIDVSHLHSVVRFSRSLTPGAPELAQAIQLAEYGSKLAQQYQYAGDPPFEDYYVAHIQFLKALANVNRDSALAYFREKLKSDVTDPDAQLVAFAYVDLLTRLDLMDEALDVATKYLSNVQEQLGFSLADLCAEAKRYDLLKQVARDKGDLLTFTAALLQGEK
ncbi:MAG: hypothetical protein JWM11_3602 [Planctomycetaceae bacterium]|nr:hypothetical protein [Planctomycetaceae bacterium]